MCGVSRQAISKAKKAKLIKLLGKQVNLDHRITCDYYYTQTGKLLRPDAITEPPPPRKTPPPKKPAAPKKPKVTKIPEETSIDNPPPEPDDETYELPAEVKTMDDVTPEILHLMPSDFITKMKNIETALSTRTKREELRGILIKRTVVRSFISKLYTVDTNQLKTLEDRLVPKMCGVFGKQDDDPESVKARKLINKEVTRILRHIKRLMDEFLTA